VKITAWSINGKRAVAAVIGGVLSFFVYRWLKRVRKTEQAYGVKSPAYTDKPGPGSNDYDDYMLRFMELEETLDEGLSRQIFDEILVNENRDPCSVSDLQETFKTSKPETVENVVHFLFNRGYITAHRVHGKLGKDVYRVNHYKVSQVTLPEDMDQFPEYVDPATIKTLHAPVSPEHPGYGFEVGDKVKLKDEYYDEMGLDNNDMNDLSTVERLMLELRGTQGTISDTPIGPNGIRYIYAKVKFGPSDEYTVAYQWLDKVDEYVDPATVISLHARGKPYPKDISLHGNEYKDFVARYRLIRNGTLNQVRKDILDTLFPDNGYTINGIYKVLNKKYSKRRIEDNLSYLNNIGIVSKWQTGNHYEFSLNHNFIASVDLPEDDEIKDIGYVDPATIKTLHAFDYNDKMVEHIMSRLESEIDAPFVNVSMSSLRRNETETIFITVSLDDEYKWPNDIFENSRYFRMSLSRPNVLEQIAKSYELPNKFRKSRVKSVDDLINRINKYIRSNRSADEDYVDPATIRTLHAPDTRRMQTVFALKKIFQDRPETFLDHADIMHLLDNENYGKDISGGTPSKGYVTEKLNGLVQKRFLLKYKPRRGIPYEWRLQPKFKLGQKVKIHNSLYSGKGLAEEVGKTATVISVNTGDPNMYTYGLNVEEFTNMDNVFPWNLRPYKAEDEYVDPATLKTLHAPRSAMPYPQPLPSGIKNIPHEKKRMYLAKIMRDIRDIVNPGRVTVDFRVTESDNNMDPDKDMNFIIAMQGPERREAYIIYLESKCLEFGGIKGFVKVNMLPGAYLTDDYKYFTEDELIVNNELRRRFNIDPVMDKKGLDGTQYQTNQTATGPIDNLIQYWSALYSMAKNPVHDENEQYVDPATLKTLHAPVDFIYKGVGYYPGFFFTDVYYGIMFDPYPDIHDDKKLHNKIKSQIIRLIKKDRYDFYIENIHNNPGTFYYVKNGEYKATTDSRHKKGILFTGGAFDNKQPIINETHNEVMLYVYNRGQRPEGKIIGLPVDDTYVDPATLKTLHAEDTNNTHTSHPDFVRRWDKLSNYEREELLVQDGYDTDDAEWMSTLDWSGLENILSQIQLASLDRRVQSSWIPGTKTYASAPGVAPRKHKLMTADIKKKYMKQNKTNRDRNNWDSRMVYTKYFNPYGDDAWYPCYYDGNNKFFGLVCNRASCKWGWFTLNTIENTYSQFRNIRLPMERDRYWNDKSIEGVATDRRRESIFVPELDPEFIPDYDNISPMMGNDYVDPATLTTLHAPKTRQQQQQYHPYITDPDERRQDASRILAHENMALVRDCLQPEIHDFIFNKMGVNEQRAKQDFYNTMMATEFQPGGMSSELTMNFHDYIETTPNTTSGRYLGSRVFPIALINHLAHKKLGYDLDTYFQQTPDRKMKEEPYNRMPLSSGLLKQFGLTTQVHAYNRRRVQDYYQFLHDRLCDTDTLPQDVDPATLTTLHALAGVGEHYQTHNVTDRDKFYAKTLWNNNKDMVIRLTGIKEFDPDDDDQVRHLSNIYTTSEPFIEKYKDKVDWNDILFYQQLSEPFIEKYKDRVDWNKISQNIRVVRDATYDYVDPATLTSLHA